MEVNAPGTRITCMRTAFKEWAVVCRALGTGRQVLILRKGGIGEEAGTFRPEHREFLFFPTGFHQSPGKVLPEADRLLREAEAEQPSADQVTFRHFAVVTDAIRVASLSALRALRGQHIWSDAVVEERFHRWQEDAVYALIVRVYALPKAITIANVKRYAGCKSWVELDVDVPTTGAVPVLADEAFGDRRAAIQKALCTAANEREE